ncbi:MAG: SDR family NAD(P)-dependent oxidoreductase [Calditrichaceae bacterium]
MRIGKKKILITGGATGIGFGLAKRFVQDDNTVIICGRRETALNDAKSKIPELITRNCDLSIETERIDLYDWISKKYSDLNVLVNNAGIQQWMDIDDPEFFSKSKQEIAINIEAPVHLSFLFRNLNSLETIINVTSGLAFVPMVKVPVYSATKAFLRSFTLSLRRFLQSKNINVIEIIPPALNTDLGGKGIHDHAPPVDEFIKAIFEQLENGSDELSYGFSENMMNAGPDQLKKVFERMNQS